MSVPFREFVHFHVATLQAESDGYAYWQQNAIGEWTDDHYNFGIIGAERYGATEYRAWFPLFIPSDPDFVLDDGMDEIVDFIHEALVAMEDIITAGITPPTSADLRANIFRDTVWDRNRVTGKYYDGVNQWSTYPPTYRNYGFTRTITFADIISNPTIFDDLNFMSCFSGTGIEANAYQDDLFDKGILAEMMNINNNFNDGCKFKLQYIPQSLRIRYLNPVVNSMSRRYSPTAGGVEIILYGLGFNNPDSELDENAWGCPASWNDRVDQIFLEGLQGQGTTTLTHGVHFTVNSNSQITIDNLPALSAGSYNMRLRKQNTALGKDVDAYAGDWFCDPDGRVRRGYRMTFLVSDTYVEKDFREKSRPLAFLDIKLRDRSGNYIEENLAQIDTMTPEKFYEGRILKVSGLERSIDDKTGTPVISDMDITLANHDRYFSKLATSYIFKNKEADLYFSWGDEPFGWKESIIKLMIDDFHRKGPEFFIRFKDLFGKYFAKQIPTEICNEENYPNIHADHVNRYMPDIIGIASLLSGEHPGAIEAVCVNTATHLYLASRGTLLGIDEVYSDDTLKATPADYSVHYADGGRTYIQFTGTQGDNTVTFNARGYLFNAWNSANGYVQNPAYVLAYFVVFLCGQPISFLDHVDIDALADYFTELGVGTGGKFLAQDKRSALEYLRQLLFSFGAKAYLQKDGRFTAGVKSVCSFADAVRIWDQIDCLEEPDRKENLPSAITTITAQWDYIPATDSYKNGMKDERPEIIDYYDEVEIEDDVRKDPLPV